MFLFWMQECTPNLDKQYVRVEKIYSETYNKSENKEVKELGWVEAKEIMMKNNLELQQAKGFFRAGKRE